MDHGELAVATSELTGAEVLVKPRRDKNQALEATYLRFLQRSRALQALPITLEILLAAADLRANSR